MGESFEPFGTTAIRADATPAENAEALIDNLLQRGKPPIRVARC